jgi:CheY-like chemotaxis protein
MVRPQFEAKQQTLETVQPGQPARILADPVRLTQVLANLLNNAVKYTPQGGHIDVRLDAGPRNVSVSVRDNGIGIEPAMLEQIFGMFHQVGKSQGGLGIGLALVKGLVELHDGSVRAHSAGEGQGSEFVVTLPCLQEDAGSQRTVLGSTESPATPRMRVLVADDNRDSATSWAILIESQGHEVMAVYDGLAAMESAASFRPQVALLDIGMPHMDGYEVARGIRASKWGRDVFLVAVTGWGQARDRARAQEAGFDEHHTKPLDPDQLERLLRNASRRLDHSSGAAGASVTRRG